MAVTVQVKMSPNWERNLNLEPALDALGKDILDDARRYCPVLSGQLRDDLDYELLKGEGDFGGLRIGARSKDYSVYVELGTSRMAAQPYLRPALEQTRVVNV